MTVDHGLPATLVIRQGQVITEIGRRWDCDESLREEVLAASGRALAGEVYEGIADAVLLWWRASDGDLSGALAEALIDCAGQGTIWLLTPSADRDGHVEPSDIAGGAATAGLAMTASFSAAPDWDATLPAVSPVRRRHRPGPPARGASRPRGTPGSLTAVPVAAGTNQSLACCGAA
jgi:Protein of unknown function (DUF3052)